MKMFVAKVLTQKLAIALVPELLKAPEPVPLLLLAEPPPLTSSVICFLFSLLLLLRLVLRNR